MLLSFVAVISGLKAGFVMEKRTVCSCPLNPTNSTLEADNHHHTLMFYILFMFSCPSLYFSVEAEIKDRR